MKTHYRHFFILKHKEDKTHKKTKKKTKRKEGIYFQALTLPSYFWLPLSPFCFQCFLLAPSSSQVEGKKKNHRKEKKCRERKELSFKLLLCPLTLCFCFCPLASTLLFQTFSPGIFFFSSRRRKKNKEKKTIEKKKLQRREGGSLQALVLPFYFWLPFLPSCFCLFTSNTFSFSSFSSQAEEKKIHKEEKKM
jgi:hypothetical protein